LYVAGGALHLSILLYIAGVTLLYIYNSLLCSLFFFPQFFYFLQSAYLTNLHFFIYATQSLCLTRSHFSPPRFSSFILVHPLLFLFILLAFLYLHNSFITTHFFINYFSFVLLVHNFQCKFIYISFSLFVIYLLHFYISFFASFYQFYSIFLSISYCFSFQFSRFIIL
jgi:hypothetical protein